MLESNPVIFSPEYQAFLLSKGRGEGREEEKGVFFEFASTLLLSLFRKRKV